MAKGSGPGSRWMVWLKFFKQFPMRQAYNKSVQPKQLEFSRGTHLARSILGAAGSVRAPPCSCTPTSLSWTKGPEGLGAGGSATWQADAQRDPALEAQRAQAGDRLVSSCEGNSHPGMCHLCHCSLFFFQYNKAFFTSHRNTEMLLHCRNHCASFSLFFSSFLQGSGADNPHRSHINPRP